jgi:hypothetical protein
VTYLIGAAAVQSGEEELDPARWRPDPAVASSIRCGGGGDGSGAVAAAVDPTTGDAPPPQALPLPEGEGERQPGEGRRAEELRRG